MTEGPKARVDARVAEASIPLVEETATIDTREVVGGRVRVRTVVDLVESIAHESLRDETLDVRRVPLDRPIADGETAPGVRTEGDEIVVPILEEVLVVEKRLVLKEEVRIRRRSEHKTVEVPVTLKKQRALVEHLDADGRPEPVDDR